jgi:hypothetical protein
MSLERVQGLALQSFVSEDAAQQGKAPVQLATTNSSPLRVHGIVCVSIATLVGLWALL